MTDPTGPGQPPPGYQRPPPGYQGPTAPGQSPFGGLGSGPFGMNRAFSLNHAAATGVSRSGLISIICGCASFLLIPAIPAVIYGVKGIREGKVTGRGVGLSIGGLICGIVGLVLVLVLLVVIVANQG